MSLGHSPHGLLTLTSAAAILVDMARDSGKPTISEFDLYVLALRLFQDRGYAGEALPARNKTLSDRRARSLLSEATWSHVWYDTVSSPLTCLPRDPDFASILYRVSPADAAEVMMAADPFCCLSHGTALAFHGLAAEPEELHFSTPERQMWRRLADEYMQQQLSVFPDFPSEQRAPFSLVRTKPHPEVRGRSVSQHESRQPPTWAMTGALRITTLGETFRDALQNPQWCGGISAVIEIWRMHAVRHLDAIVEAVDAGSEKILQVRAGYLLEEAIGISDPRIDVWARSAQRGSSRKLDSAAPYANRFSERWMLSINVPDSTLPSRTN